MPWYKSFENISKLLTLVAGLVLLFIEQTEIGMALLASSGILVAAKAADKKKGKAAAAILMCGLLCFSGSACGTLQKMPGEVVDLNMQVYDMYDYYVQQDPELDLEERMNLLHATSFLRKVMSILRSGVDSLELILPGPMVIPIPNSQPLD